MQLLVCSSILAQGVFESNTSNGNWNSASSWTLVSGSDSNGKPDSNDIVTILAGDRINMTKNHQCDDLTIEGRLHYPSNKTLTVNGDLVMSGTIAEITGNNNNRTLNVLGSFSVPSGADVDISGQRVTITGTTTLDGKLNFGSNTGNKTFGNIDINSTGTWNNTGSEDFVFTGNLINDGTFNGCSGNGCNYEFTSTSGTISGSGTITLSDLIIDAPADITNIASIVITDDLKGDGDFTNGNGATLELQRNGPFDIDNFDASTNANTVIYTEGSTGTINSGTYYNLTINKSGSDKTQLGGNVTVSNILTLTNGDLELDSHTLTMADGATISGGSSSSYIRINSSGVVRQNYSSSGATLSFPIGDSGDYTPITAFKITSGTFGAGAYVEFDITDLNHPNRNTSNTGAGGDDTGLSTNAFISRYWTLTGNNITSPRYDATYQYVNGDVSGTESEMVPALYRIHPTLGISDWYVSGTVNPVTNTVSFTNADAFGDLYAMDNGSARLPIVLISFDAEVVGSAVRLNWSTASEINNEIYTIERSSNGIDFESILYKEGAGDSNQTLHYSLSDVNPLPGRSYYRLKQTDFNGTFEYSEVVSVLRDYGTQRKPSFKTLLTPGETLEVVCEKDEISQITMLDLNGTRIEQWIPQTSNVSLRIPTGLKSGVYLLVFDGIDGRSTTKVVVRN